MGLFDWLASLFGAPRPPRGPVARFTGDGICPYCGAELASDQAQQCFSCGADWHDPRNVVVRGAPGQRGVPASVERRRSEPAASASPSPPRPQKREDKDLSHLDAGAFAPLAHGDVKSAARSLGSLWNNPWFGRRDLIPPVSDARTQLIDRAMVGQGLITPEELTAIHDVGAEMDRVRPDLATARHRAADAVERTKEEREELKRQKKAEAAQRRRRRAEEIARRKATDIVFLGRGVSRGLADRRSNVERLEAYGLPVLSTPAEVAQALGVAIGRLRWLAFHTPAATRTHYVEFEVPKKSGGTRRLFAPHHDLARCQAWVLRNVLDKLAAHEAVHGFIAGRSTVSNAAVHVQQDLVLNLDLIDFFPTITFPRAAGALRSIGYSPAVATVLGLLCTECPRRVVELDGQRLHVATGERSLPQGACTSPALSNLVCRKLDRRLSGLAAKLDWRYTRYADDITLSASGEAAKLTAYVMARARHIVADEGFELNAAKTRVLRRNASQRVTGIVVNQQPGVPRKTVRRLRAILHRAGREGLEAQNREGHPHFEAWLRGMIAYVAMVNPRQGRPLREAFEALR